MRRLVEILPGAIAVAAIALLSGCRTSRPAGNETPLAPLTSTSADAVIPELTRRMTSLHAIRSLMRIRATTGERTQSFRAQLLVEPQSGRMELIAYTPIGTDAMTLIADGDRVVFLDHIHKTAWQGSASSLAQTVGFFDPHTPPAAWALDVLGFPGAGDFRSGESGLSTAAIGDVRIAFDPPSFPPHNVTVTRGASRLEITHLELASTDASVPPPQMPADYRCCVAPEM